MPVPAEDLERTEELLRSEVYTALVELGLAEKQAKLPVVNRLSLACIKLQALIEHGRLPEAGLEKS